MAAKERKIKVYADRLEKDLLSRKWTIVANAIIYILGIGLILFLSLRGDVVVIGDNLVATGKSGFSESSAEVMEIQADGHANLLYKRFFTFDYNNFESQKNKAIYLGDKSLEDVYVALKNAGFFEEILANHYAVSSYLDSTKIKLGSRGVALVDCFGRMELSNNFYLEVRKLDLHLKLTQVSHIKELNPFGFSIINLNLISNEILETKSLGQ